MFNVKKSFKIGEKVEITKGMYKGCKGYISSDENKSHSAYRVITPCNNQCEGVWIQKSYIKKG